MKWRRRALAAVSVAATISGTAYAARFKLYEGTHDGPFIGRPRADCAALPQPPNDSLVLPNSRRLETYDAATRTSSATLLLREADGTISWCIIADGFDPGDTRWIRFGGYETTWTDDIVVTGGVRWTFGEEHAMWRLRSTGALEAYWYAW